MTNTTTLQSFTILPIFSITLVTSFKEGTINILENRHTTTALGEIIIRHVRDMPQRSKSDVKMGARHEFR